MDTVEKILRKYDFSVDEDKVNSESYELSKKKSINFDIRKIAKDLINILDLTTLEGKDTKDTVDKLCKKAINPIGESAKYIHSAAVCVYPVFIRQVRENLKGTGIKTAAVGTGFPSGQYHLKVRLLDVELSLQEGAEEIDMVISRGEFLSGNYDYVYNEIKSVKDLCRDVTLKVILETGELGSYENIRKASFLAMEAGADFIKTSTGKISPAATIPGTYVMLKAIEEFYSLTGKKTGIKPAGGIKTFETALEYYLLVYDVSGVDGLNNSLFRIGASSLLDNLVKLVK